LVSAADIGYMPTVGSFEIVVKERLSPALIEATETDSACFAGGMTTFVAHDCNQVRLHSLFNFLRDVNVTLVSVNAVVPGNDGERAASMVLG
jgi:hypothetical protein